MRRSSVLDLGDVRKGLGRTRLVVSDVEAQRIPLTVRTAKLRLQWSGSIEFRLLAPFPIAGGVFVVIGALLVRVLLAAFSLPIVAVVILILLGSGLAPLLGPGCGLGIAGSLSDGERVSQGAARLAPTMCESSSRQ